MYSPFQRGKTAHGVWKDIVNVEDYTQTIRYQGQLHLDYQVQRSTASRLSGAEVNYIQTFRYQGQLHLDYRVERSTTPRQSGTKVNCI